ncbi:MAG: putative zinc-binding protein [candidate division Zixibacteria bacterium]|jgi:uncharacterized metal-binding protein|nr:putative zinc-binding protein [candidate division Zixibacteria bacterium]
MNEEKPCACSISPKLIFACSGAADTGEIADLAARKLTRDKIGTMYCLAGIGGRISGIMKSTQSAAGLVAIDGCPLDCAAHTLDQAGFNNFKHIRITDLGMIKGKTPVTDDNVGRVYHEVSEILKTISEGVK